MWCPLFTVGACPSLYGGPWSGACLFRLPSLSDPGWRGSGPVAGPELYLSTSSMHAATAAHCLAQQPNSSRQWLNSLPWWGPQGPSHFLYLWTLGLEAPNHSHPHSYFRFLVCDFEGAITLWIGSSMIFILPNSQNFTATDVITV